MSAIEKLLAQQAKVKARSPQWMAAEQLMDICRSEPHSAKLLDKDLDVASMSIVEAEKKIKAFADSHKLNGFACVTPVEADMASEANTPASLYEIDRYLQKQQARHGLPIAAALVMYLDYWELLDDADPAPEQVWPPNLRAAHDRVVMSRAAENDKKYLKGFVCVCREWGALEWSDGQICAVLPRCNNDLVAEGKTLHHCVGGYGGQHVAGKLIIFIRHARRPERSWFTLNIDTTGQKWSEVQLHGYGNEFAHGKHLSIPKEVRAFVDRWEKEVLTPVFRKVKAQRRDAEAEPQAAERPRLRAGGAA